MDEETVEFNVAHNRKYSTDHLWYQEKDERLMIGVSEFLRLEIGDILEVKLRQVESNPELVNESAYDLGWVIILEPHDFDTELLLDPDEYVEYLAEL